MIENLQALVAVVEARSLPKASARLYVTQSAVSRRLQQLEETLGADLFDRAQRPPAPTAMGLRVYEQALPILQSVEDLLAMTKEKADPAGILRLGMAHGIDAALAHAHLDGIAGHEGDQEERQDFPCADDQLDRHQRRRCGDRCQGGALRRARRSRRQGPCRAAACSPVS